MFRHSAIIAFFAVVSQLMGVLRDRLLAHYVGIGQALDIYNAAFRLPDLVFGIMASFVTAGTVLPFLSTSHAKGETAEFEKRFSSLFFSFIGVVTIVAIVVAICAPQLAHIVVPGFSTEARNEYIFYTRILMMQAILLGASTLISCLAQLRHTFVLFSIIPIIYTSFIILGILFYPTYGLPSLFAGVIFGAFVHLLLQSAIFIRYPARVHLSLFSYQTIREYVLFALPRTGTTIITQIRITIFTSIASLFGPGSLTVYLFAQKIADAFIVILSQSFGTSSLPHLSKHASLGENHHFEEIVRKNVITVGAVALVGSVACYLFAPQIIQILYGTTTHNNEISSVFRILTIGLPGYVIGAYSSYVFYALKDTKTVFYLNTFFTLVGVAITYAAINMGYGLVSVAYGSMVMWLTYIPISFFVYRRKELI